MTQLDMLRGLVSRDGLAPDAPPCLPRDLLTAAEVASLRGCTPTWVYNLRRRGGIEGPPGEPYRFFGWSVLRVIGWAEAPPTPVSTEPPPRARAKRVKDASGLIFLRDSPRADS